MQQKKRHHFVAQTYLRGFCNDQGKVCAYLKDNPDQQWWAAPDTIAFEKYYYSQPVRDGSRDNNSIEDFFSTIEAEWPAIVGGIKRRENSPGSFERLFEFAVMHRIRVPVVRDAVEAMLAESVRLQAFELQDKGHLPELPAGYSAEKILSEANISIDPHMSIHAMAHLAKSMNAIIHAVGFEILENESDEGFITSDNPVIYFDPNTNPDEVQPYNIDRNRNDVEFMFPLTPHHMLWGHPKIRSTAVHYRSINDREFVKRANAFLARFAYRMIFSDKPVHQALISEHAATSPVVSITHTNTPLGRSSILQLVFGKRKQKPKWRSADTQE